MRKASNPNARDLIKQTDKRGKNAESPKAAIMQKTEASFDLKFINSNNEKMLHPWIEDQIKKKHSESRETLLEIKTFITEMNISIEGLNSEVEGDSQEIEQDKKNRREKIEPEKQCKKSNTKFIGTPERKQSKKWRGGNYLKRHQKMWTDCPEYLNKKN